ncbi:MAG: hypothetical protein IPP14_14945 [Planctomycetes bacterium]|nr:hypothetical protein [Planctomycetota bacterium]
MSRLLIALLLVFAPVAYATTALKLSLDKLTDTSSRIVVAKAGASEARWDAAKTGIWTHVSVTISETLKGDSEKTLDVAIRGGVVGTVGQHVAGAGNLEKDKEYLLFLWKDDAGRWQLQGMIQGAFALETRQNVVYARNSLTGLTIVDAATLKPAADKAAVELKLSDARTSIAARIKANQPEQPK